MAAPLPGDDVEPSSYVMPTDALLVPPTGSGGTLTEPTVSSITVPPTVKKIRDVNVMIDITHTFNDDLEVSLKHVPSDTTAELWKDLGGSGDNVRVVVDDDAIFTLNDTDLGGANTTIKGWYKPENPAALTVFNGQTAGGEWQLIIKDDAGSDTGMLHAWVLQITD